MYQVEDSAATAASGRRRNYQTSSIPSLLGSEGSPEYWGNVGIVPENEKETIHIGASLFLNSGNKELMKMVDELQSKLEAIKAERAAETEQVQKELQMLNAENAKLQYRITHLVRALKEADCKLMSS
ncbi:hypothetical protein M9H77_04048 [Catharanthus roseus]|uniref:Uncharacterized protein n=1 Tax=Catharanthus roseus TaxID=4058 RepID=A0ACC0CD18_CATRO|nr:hypothetical protein M9H77_04048 [Catharanthus roseus]